MRAPLLVGDIAEHFHPCQRHGWRRHGRRHGPRRRFWRWHGRRPYGRHGYGRAIIRGAWDQSGLLWRTDSLLSPWDRGERRLCRTWLRWRAQAFHNGTADFGATVTSSRSLVLGWACGAGTMAMTAGAASRTASRRAMRRATAARTHTTSATENFPGSFLGRISGPFFVASTSVHVPLRKILGKFV